MSYNFVKKTMPSEIIDNFVPFKKNGKPGLDSRFSQI